MADPFTFYGGSNGPGLGHNIGTDDPLNTVQFRRSRSLAHCLAGKLPTSASVHVLFLDQQDLHFNLLRQRVEQIRHQSERSPRVTCPEGDQKPTHFLQLPFKFAAPLTITSGLLHWLLSQSLYLVRLEARRRDGTLYPSSKCACGYSVVSILNFTIILLILVITVGVLLFLRVQVRVHCSLIISAACHPPTDDVDCHLKPVQWGVVEKGIEHMPGHCTLTSHDVQMPQDGFLYA